MILIENKPHQYQNKLLCFLGIFGDSPIGMIKELKDSKDRGKDGGKDGGTDKNGGNDTKKSFCFFQRQASPSDEDMISEKKFDLSV